MANGINIGVNNVSSIKIGTADVSAVYIGTNLVYSASTQPTLQWVEFNYGDDISGLDIYGVSGTALNLSSTFGLHQTDTIFFSLERNIVYCSIGNPNVCYTNYYSLSDADSGTYRC